MTNELLMNANAIQNRIEDVTKLLDSLDVTNTMNGVPKISPIIIHAGMSQMMQFDVLPNDVDLPITEMQRLDARIYTYLVNLLQDYKRQLEEMFKNLA